MIFDDQLRACRLLWLEYPVSVQSRQVNLNRIYSTPFPRQRELPLWFGVAATKKDGLRVIPFTLPTVFLLKLIPDGKQVPLAPDLSKDKRW